MNRILKKVTKIKFKEYLICSLTKKMFDQSGYNLNDIDELEEIEPSLVDNKKMMNKNFSAFEFL